MEPLICPSCKEGEVYEVHLESYSGTTCVEEDDQGRIEIVDQDWTEFDRDDAWLDRYQCGSCDAEWANDEVLLAAIKEAA